MRGIETVAGGVELDHNFNDEGEGGTEVVRNDVTDAETFVHYDGQNRVTQQVDPYGFATTYSYDEDPEANIKGALEWEEDALGVKTAYEYPDFNTNNYSSFSDMFSSYVNQQMGSDLTQNGYLTGAQGGPSVVTQDSGGANQTSTQLSYITDTDHPAVFQPSTVTVPGNNVTTLAYDEDTGQMTDVSFTANGNGGAEVSNEYYAANDVDLIYGGDALAADSPLIGQLKRTSSKATPSAPARDTEYGYKYVYNPDGTLKEQQNATRQVRDGLPDITTYSCQDALGNLLWSKDSKEKTSSSAHDGEGRVTYTKDSKGNEIWISYDYQGRRIYEKNMPALITGSPIIRYETYYEYDESARVVKTTRTGTQNASTPIIKTLSVSET